MNFISLPFNMFFSFISQVVLPIRLSENLVFNLPLLAVFFGSVVFGVIFWFFSKLFGIEVNYFFSSSVRDFNLNRDLKRSSNLHDKYIKSDVGYLPVKFHHGKKIINEKSFKK